VALLVSTHQFCMPKSGLTYLYSLQSNVPHKDVQHIWQVIDVAVARLCFFFFLFGWQLR
jgi:hypothetical protein